MVGATEANSVNQVQMTDTVLSCTFVFIRARGVQSSAPSAL